MGLLPSFRMIWCRFC